MTSRRRVHSTRKRQGGRRDSDGLPASTSTSERERELENTINDLKRQLHDALVANIIDLRVAGGLLTENERSKSQATVAKLSNEALEFIKRDLVKSLTRISAIVSPAPSMTRESRDYIA